MDIANENNIGDTVRIRRPARVTTNALGHTTWMGEVDPSPFELIIEPRTDPYNTATLLSVPRLRNLVEQDSSHYAAAAKAW